MTAAVVVMVQAMADADENLFAYGHTKSGLKSARIPALAAAAAANGHS